MFRGTVLYGEEGSDVERDLGWLDFTVLGGRVFSSEGEVLLNEVFDGGGETGAIFLRHTNGSPPVHLGEGFGVGLSKDGDWVFATRNEAPDVLHMIPTGAGMAREIRFPDLTVVWAVYLGDSNRIAVRALEPSGNGRVFVHDLETQKSEEIGEPPRGPAGILSPDGQRVAYPREDGSLAIRDLEGGPAAPVKGAEIDDIPVQWSSDEKTIWVTTRQAMPRLVYSIDLETGTRTLWKEIAPRDRTGVIRIDNVLIAPDGKSWAYETLRVTSSDLYVAKMSGM